MDGKIEGERERVGMRVCEREEMEASNTKESERSRSAVFVCFLNERRVEAINMRDQSCHQVVLLLWIAFLSLSLSVFQESTLALFIIRIDHV